jgi:hypothetical protein
MMKSQKCPVLGFFFVLNFLQAIDFLGKFFPYSLVSFFTLQYFYLAILYDGTCKEGTCLYILRTQIGSKRSGIGLGSCPDVTLASAHEKAQATKEVSSSAISLFMYEPITTIHAITVIVFSF